MDRNLAKDRVKSKLNTYLQNKGIKTGKPFRCLSRSHEDKNPSMSYDNKREKVHCFGCGVDWDIFDVIGDEYGLSNDKDKFNKAYEIFGIDINNSQNQPKIVYQFDNVDDSNQIPLNDNDPTDQVEGVRADLKPFFLQAQSNIGDPNCKAYLLKRGISMETATKYRLGYVSDWKSPKVLSEGKNPPATPRIIIPTSKNSYLARDIRDDEEVPETQKAYTKMKVGGVAIFNIDALTNGEPCFVTEGEFDALSFSEIGVNAAAIGSTSNTTLLLKQLETLSTYAPLILALDNDDSGKQATIDLTNGLKEQNKQYLIFNTDYNDPNDFLVNDRLGFERDAQECLKSLDEKLSEEAQGAAEEAIVEMQEYLQGSVYHKVAAFRDSIKLSKDKNFISTGFTRLDEVLGGGLYDALYVLGAISSLGKTTFAIQIADYIASQGHDVLYFSLEMSTYEIMAKSISRHTYLHCSDNGIPANLSKDTRQITTGRNYKDSMSMDFIPQECDIIYCAEENYKKYADKLFIHEGVGNLGAEKIKLAVMEHQKYTGNAPIVIVDYLQILAPSNERATDKQNTDKAVLELKRISRDFKIPVIAISSLNRQSYKDKINMEAFKESGAIEYSSDVLIGLQLKGVSDNNFNVDIAKSKTPREVELKVLKNRNGKTGDSIDFNYYSHINLFKEVKIQTK
jgi:replicative DNA helicase